LYIGPGDVYYRIDPDKVIVEYYQVSGYGPGPDSGTWEVILLQNGSILFQYQDVAFGDSHDDGASATIGIQGDSSTSLQYSYNTASLTDGMAICFAYPGTPPNCTPVDIAWLSEDPTKGTVLADSTFPVPVTFDTTGLAIGDYFAKLIVATDDAENGVTYIPVTLHVVEPGRIVYMPIILRDYP
jgi:hypothetical protein